MASPPSELISMPSVAIGALIVLLAMYGLYKILESVDFIHTSWLLLLLFLLACYFIFKYCHRQYTARRNVAIFPLPLRKWAAIAAAILYLVSPIDIIPDILPVLGFADDAALFFALAYYVFSAP